MREGAKESANQQVTMALFMETETNTLILYACIMYISICGHNEHKQLSNATKTITKTINNCTMFRLLCAVKKVPSYDNARTHTHAYIRNRRTELLPTLDWGEAYAAQHYTCLTGLTMPTVKQRCRSCDFAVSIYNSAGGASCEQRHRLSSQWIQRTGGKHNAKRTKWKL